MPTTYDRIATTTLGSNQTTLVLSSIPNTYTDLRIVVVRPGSPGASAGYPYISAINGSTTTDKSYTYISGDGSTASSSRATNNNNILCASGGGGDTSGFIVDVFSYAGSTFKSFLIASMADTNGGGYVDRISGLWRSTSAITSITFTSNAGTNGYQTGTTATIYGILRA